MCNLALRVWERQIGMEQSMVKFEHSPKKIEYSIETRWIFNISQTIFSFFSHLIVLVSYSDISNLRFSFFLIQLC
jgi:hypothetical protein